MKGPISLDWLAQAGSLPGKALHVGIVLWFQAGLRRSTTLPLSNGVLRLFGVDRHAKSRALDVMEQAKLITCERRSGCSPIVTLLDVTAAP
ncbi:MAG TPA: hypothetical protein EYN73_04830 [Chromatiaceae bacterium]|nr:hypothetical protein [Chromatiaceae bacterium]